ncbi:MAG: grasp-with-spasm system ATP-grasp peptide maturase [Bacteroidales bacterium]|nr:grasp-with-spasm system ATP-grasp peptide maturase [Bacteroidales bacterium]
MILILSEEKDISATKVSNWLYYYDVPFLRIDDNASVDIVDLVTIENNKTEILFTYKNKQYSLDGFSVVWNRRGFFEFSLPQTDFLKNETKTNSDFFYQHLKEESFHLKNYIGYKIAEKFHIDDFRFYSLNKLIVLDIASKIGFKIPETNITTDFKNIKNIAQELITKNIQDVIPFFDNKYLFKQGTKEVDKNQLEQDPTFFYSLFQQKIEKKYEIRTFIFFDKLFSMAIFSQNNEKTKIDFRNYDDEKRNRMIPYILPKEIEEKLLKLMQKLKIQSGSADLIFDGKDYFFLEINPVGQLDFVSGYCNYQIEKHIANFIKDKYYELKKAN